MPYLLGIDLGTTTCRCAIFSLDGERVALAAGQTPVAYPRPLWAEGDPAAWWTTVCLVVREALSAVCPEGVAAVGVTGLMHAPVFLDEAGQPLGAALLWMDQRCAAQVAAMNAERGPGEPSVATMFSAPKIRWLAEEQPELLARARAFVLPKDFLRIQLTGVGGTDPSDAWGTGLFDRERAEWLDHAVELSRLPRALLPTVRPAWALAGGVTDAAAAATGLVAGTPVAVGGSDVFCTRIGVGPLAEGEACLYMGTAAWMSLVEAGGATRGIASTATTGAALRWTRDLLLGAGGDSSYDDLLAGVEEVEPGAEGLFFLPHLMGERGPEPDPLARGALVGLTLRHGRAHIVRAVLEGTAFQIRHNVDRRARVPVRGGVVAGGAAASRLWMQVLVDVLSVALRTPAETESSVLGAALLGGVAAGLFTLEQGRARMVRAGRCFRPDAERAACYTGLYEQFCQLDEALLPFFRKVGAAAEAPTFVPAGRRPAVVNAAEREELLHRGERGS